MSRLRSIQAGSDVHELVDILKSNPNVIPDIRYATADNIFGRVIYSKPCCYLRKKTAAKFAAAQKEFESIGLTLKVFDCYRPLSIQRMLWERCPDERYVADPAKGSAHNRGAAVDVTLVDLKTGKELRMPSAYDDFSEKSHRNSLAADPLAAHNSVLLESVMIKYGFIGARHEWWHFDDSEATAYPLLDIPFDALD